MRQPIFKACSRRSTRPPRLLAAQGVQRAPRQATTFRALPPASRAARAPALAPPVAPAALTPAVAPALALFFGGAAPSARLPLPLIEQDVRLALQRLLLADACHL
eukprot:scaffold23216_cov61-Phaeocystis_antarctica.AAC.3